MILPKVQNFLYQKAVKPIFFAQDPERVHERTMRLGERLGSFGLTRGLTSLLFDFEDERLAQEVLGLHFRNPVGLSAGFDYEARLIEILPAVGFGFHTVGTITNEPYAGNPSPRLARLPKSKSLLVNKGFKSQGIEAGLDKMRQARRRIPLGLSIGSTNKRYEHFRDQIADVVQSYQAATQAEVNDYFELNISCPNLANIDQTAKSFATVDGLRELLQALAKLNIKRPVFIKMHLEKSLPETEALIELASEFDFIQGLIFANLCKDRSNPKFDRAEIQTAGQGNFSGRPTFDQSNELIKATYRKYGERFVIIGVGGIFSAEDAYEKIKCGATLVQLITGMVFEGPQLIGQINRGLVELLERDGFANISEAIGSAQR